jgi:transcriptional regulator with XRE-family HTH domain/predicted DNA-binding transcriptional regulator AlpA
MPKRLMNKDNAPACRKAMGERLHDERIARHWNQKELAKRANVNAHIITNIETGHVLNPTAESVIRVARVLNLRSEWLLDGVGEKYVPGPVEIPTAERIEIERVPLELAKALLKIVEEMQYSRLFCEGMLSTKHVDRWLGLLLAQPELRSIGDHFMRAALESDPALPGSRPTLVVNNVSMLPERTVETGVVLPTPEAQPAVTKTASLRVPPADRPAVDDKAEFAELGNVVTSLDPFKGAKLGRLKKGSYTDIAFRKRQQRRDGLLSQNDVCGLLGISAATFWTWSQNDADFPAPAALNSSGKADGYRRADFEYYLRQKLLERKHADTAKAANG